MPSPRCTTTPRPCPAPSLQACAYAVASRGEPTWLHRIENRFTFCSRPFILSLHSPVTHGCLFSLFPWPIPCTCTDASLRMRLPLFANRFCSIFIESILTILSLFSSRSFLSRIRLQGDQRRRIDCSCHSLKGCSGSCDTKESSGEFSEHENQCS